MEFIFSIFMVFDDNCANNTKNLKVVDWWFCFYIFLSYYDLANTLTTMIYIFKDDTNNIKFFYPKRFEND